MSTALLEVERYRVALGGRTVVDIERLSIDAGELAVVVGDAGSGKTALAAGLAGSLPAQGSVRVAGVRVDGPASRRRRAGLSAAVRDGRRIAGCTVVEALTLASARNGVAQQMLERFPQLATRRRVPAVHLSGGEQQLLQIACAWCARPRVLVLDSPTVGLAVDAATAVTGLARDHAAAGDAVLWLEQDARAAPHAPRAALVSGQVQVLGSAAANRVSAED